MDTDKKGTKNLLLTSFMKEDYAAIWITIIFTLFCLLAVIAWIATTGEKVDQKAQEIRLELNK